MGLLGDFFGAVWDIGKTVVEVGKTIYNEGKKLLGFGDEVAQEVSEKGSYKKEEAHVEETVDIYDELGKFKKKVSKQSREIEGKITEICQGAFDNLASGLYELNQMKIGGRQLSINADLLRSESKKLLREIDGSIESEIMPKISIDNRECLEILEMDKGKSKKKRMKSFIDEKSISALRKLKSNLKNGLDNAHSNISETLDNKFEQIEIMTKQKIETLEILKSNDDVLKRQETQAGIAQQICVSNMMLEKLKTL
ncbi:hypothetical protein [Campylobacter devanensis]|uniref:hypothetical protein n=1 Tax=Campylobacter devanensis TaxID=3161138 RepID=UPI000A34675B|nr:hypothetical protein [Campylobacter sp. P146]